MEKGMSKQVGLDEAPFRKRLIWMENGRAGGHFLWMIAIVLSAKGQRHWDNDFRRS
jgi:hypothetical protein